MWNIFLAGFLLCSALCHADVSHLPGVEQHSGFSSEKSDHRIELPDKEAPTGYVQNRYPESQLQGSNTGGVINIDQLPKSQNQGHNNEHYHGQDGNYNHYDDGKGWDIRKSIPGEPDQDYPVYDSVPSTIFTCKEKIPGYYADEEARCQVFRICTTKSLKTHYSFLCPNGTLFNQRLLTCDWWMNVDCTASSDFYYKNMKIGEMPTGKQLMDQVIIMIKAPYETTPPQNPIKTTNSNKVDTNQFGINQNTTGSILSREEQERLREISLEKVQNEYIPPSPKVDESTLSEVKTNDKKIDQSSSSGLTDHENQNDVPSTVTSQVTNQVKNPPNPSVTVTKERSHTVTHSQKTTHVFKDLNDEGPNKISLLENTNIVPVQVLPNIKTDNKHEIYVQTQPHKNFGENILTPRKLDHHPIPAPDFGQNLGFSQFHGDQIDFQNTPEVYIHQSIQPNLFGEQNFPAGAFIQNHGYQYQHPNFQEQNYNFGHNIEVSKDGSAQNFKGQSVTQHSNGQTHSTFSGHNVAVKESTKVDVVPSLSFDLNNDFDKNSYINAVLSGLINDGSLYQHSASSNIGQHQFVPSDDRFSSYQGPSSYLVPQGSVPRFPSNSGYYR